MFFHSCHNTPPQDCDCRFGVSAPGRNDACWMNNAFNLYAMQIEKEREQEVTEDGEI